jgi:cytochrome P450/NADPH-cytochrome P450 reductase
MQPNEFDPSLDRSERHSDFSSTSSSALSSTDSTSSSSENKQHSDNKKPSYAVSFFKNEVLPKFFTGMRIPRFPNAAFLDGDIFWGQTWKVFEADGLGVNHIITEAAKLALHNEYNMCQWRIGPSQHMLLPLDPEDIYDIIHVHKDNYVNHDSTGSFREFFGDKSILAFAFGSEPWQQARKEFTTAFGPPALKTVVKPLLNILHRHIKTKAEQDSDSFDLTVFCNSMAMDMIGQKLGLHQVSHDQKIRIMHFIQAIATEVATFRTQALKKYLPQFLYPSAKKYFDLKLDDLLEEATIYVRDIVLPPNEHWILGNINWLNKDGKLTRDALYQKETIQRIFELYVAGSETTATLMFFTIRMLTAPLPQHEFALNKLKAEIDALGIPPEEWTYESIENLPYLKLVLQEVLRLYPPIPEIVFEFHTPTKTRAGTIQKGDAVVVSTRHTHRLQSVWGPDAEDFRPERFQQSEDTELKMEGAHKKNPSHAFRYLPFGPSGRHCPGQHLAKLETSLLVGYLLYYYDLKIAADSHHPLESYQRFTLHPKEEHVLLHIEQRPERQLTRMAGIANRPPVDQKMEQIEPQEGVQVGLQEGLQEGLREGLQAEPQIEVEEPEEQVWSYSI